MGTDKDIKKEKPENAQGYYPGSTFKKYTLEEEFTALSSALRAEGGISLEVKK